MQGLSFPHRLQYTLTPFIYIATLSPSCAAKESQPPVTNSPKTFGARICFFARYQKASVVVASLWEELLSRGTRGSAIPACRAASLLLHCAPCPPWSHGLGGAGHSLATPCPSLKNNRIYKDKIFLVCQVASESTISLDKI